VRVAAGAALTRLAVAAATDGVAICCTTGIVGRSAAGLTPAIGNSKAAVNPTTHTA
jgi:hypothetical protein